MSDWRDMAPSAFQKSVKALESYREREIIKLRYGLDGGYSYTLEEVGRIFKVTRERVRQVEVKAFRNIRNNMRKFLNG